MPGSVIGKSLNFGWIGKITRQVDAIVTNKIVSNAEGATDIAFGAPVFLNDDNTVRNVTSTDTIEKFMGFAVSEVKQATVYGKKGNIAYYTSGNPCDILTRGSLLVKLAAGDATAGGKVYLAIKESSSDSVVAGDILAKAISEVTVELTNCKFTTGLVDGNGCVEVTISNKNLI